MPKNPAAQTAREIVSATIGHLNSVAGALTGAKKLAETALARLPGEAPAAQKAALEKALCDCDQTLGQVRELIAELNATDKRFTDIDPAAASDLKAALAKLRKAKADDETLKYNPNHDESGRFSSDDDGGNTPATSGQGEAPALALPPPLTNEGYGAFSGLGDKVVALDKKLHVAEIAASAVAGALLVASFRFPALRSLALKAGGVEMGVQASRGGLAYLHGKITPTKSDGTNVTPDDFRAMILDAMAEAKAEKLSAPDAAKAIYRLMKTSLHDAAAFATDPDVKAKLDALSDQVDGADISALDAIDPSEAPRLNKVLREMQAGLDKKGKDESLKYDPSQPRADDGQWSSSGGGALVASGVNTGTARNPHTVQVVDREYVSNVNMAEITGNVAKYSSAVALGVGALSAIAFKTKRFWPVGVAAGAVSLAATAVAGYAGKKHIEARMNARLLRPLDAKSDFSRDDFLEMIKATVKGELIAH